MKRTDSLIVGRHSPERELRAVESSDAILTDTRPDCIPNQMPTCPGIPKRHSPVTRKMADGDLHGAFVQAGERAFPVRHPDHGWFDMRRGKQRFWGNILRRVDELIDNDVPIDVVLRIPTFLTAYIRERCIERDADKYSKPQERVTR